MNKHHLGLFYFSVAVMLASIACASSTLRELAAACDTFNKALDPWKAGKCGR